MTNLLINIHRREAAVPRDQVAYLPDDQLITPPKPRVAVAEIRGENLDAGVPGSSGDQACLGAARHEEGPGVEEDLEVPRRDFVHVSRRDRLAVRELLADTRSPVGYTLGVGRVDPGWKLGGEQKRPRPELIYDMGLDPGFDHPVAGFLDALLPVVVATTRPVDDAEGGCFRGGVGDVGSEL